MTQIDGLHIDLANPTINDAHFERMIDIAKADRQYAAARAIGDLSFAWKILQYDVDEGTHQFVPDTERNRTPISKEFALWTEQDEGSLVSIIIGSRVIRDDAELELIASGPKAKNMLMHFYELDDPEQQYTRDDPATKFHLPPYDFERMKFAERTSTLVNFLQLPLRKRNALQRYDARHRPVRQ